MKPGLQQFGGNWTEQKLDVLSRYLNAYTNALKNQPFRLLYIDAFAGTGYREIVQKDDQIDLAKFDVDEDTERFLDGSARMSLKLDHPFDQYLFIENLQTKCNQLAKIKSDFPTLADRIDCRNDDCNIIIKEFCSKVNWKEWRGVLFLDPFGMNVDWDTMKIAAETQAIDVWVLFPLGSAVNRLLMRDGARIQESWSNKLDSIFGTHEWYDRFYTETISDDLFGQTERKVQKTGNLQAIAAYYLERLRDAFSAVAETPRMMYNSKQNPIFMFCFAMGNPARKAQEIALRIANHILKKV